MRLFDHLRRGAFGAALVGALAFSFGLWAQAAQAEPAIWRADASGGTVYMFGTFHLLKKDVVWDTPKLDDAFSASQELWLEIKDPDDPAAMAPLVFKYGMDRDHPLSSKLTRRDQARLAKDAAAVGMSAAMFEPMRPWFAALVLSIKPLEKAGYGADNGVDLALKAKADTRHEPVEAFETVEQQLRYFADLPPKTELSYLHQTLQDFDLDLKDLDKAAADWAKGDTDGIYRILFADLRAGSPELYDLLIKKRNEAMADQIAARLAKGGTIFVAVGAGHLVGPDSIQAALERRGIHVKRM